MILHSKIRQRAFQSVPSQVATETIENEKEEVRLPKDDVRRRGQEEKMGSHL